MQQSFRKSLSSAVNQPGNPTSNAMVTDVHIPNPADTFGVGSVTPFTGSASSVVRNFRLDETADNQSELPQATFNVNGQTFSYYTAGMRSESNVPSGSLSRYQEIYGSGNVWTTGSGDCLDEETSTDPNTGAPIITCNEASNNLNIIDYCAGEIIDYGTAVKQCRMIVDSAACVTECTRNHYLDNSGTDCSSICSEPVNVPWYCANYTETDSVNHTYNFPVLEQLFASSALKAMGLQQNYTQHTTTNNSLRKTEDTSGITTTDNVNWETDTTRKIITNPLGSTSGDVNTGEATSEVSQSNVESQNTGW